MRPIRAIVASGRAAAAITYRSRLQFPGADGSTTFTDDTGKTWSAFGNAQIDTSLGDQRGLFDGSGDYITTPDHADLQFGTGDFTIEFTLRYNSKTGFQTIASRGYTINAPDGLWLIQTGNGDELVTFYHSFASSVVPVVSDTTTTVSTGVDYLIKIRRVGTTVTLEVNGSLVATGTSSTNFNLSAETSIGGGSSSGYNNFWFNGWIKDFRIY